MPPADVLASAPAGEVSPASAGGASRSTTRHLAWAETDAAGHHHFSAAVRWLEESEHGLWIALGLEDVVRATPRVHLELDFVRRVYFNDPLTVTTTVERLGRTSVTFRTDVRAADGGQVVAGRHVVVHCPVPGGDPEPWPDEVRDLLGGKVGNT